MKNISSIKNLRILFTTPPHNNSTKNKNFMHMFPSLGLLYLISETKKYFPDADEKYLEGDYLLDDYAKKVTKISPDIVAISVSFFNCEDAVKTIKRIKKEKRSTFVIAGGPYATSSPEFILEKGNADVCVIGESEKTFVELIRYAKGEIKKLAHIDGIAFRKNGKILRTKKREFETDLNRHPFPYWDSVDFSRYPGYFYHKRSPEMIFVSSRGCPFNCNFCSDPVGKLSKPWKRYRSPKNIKAEIKTLSERYDIKEMFDFSDEFNIDLKWANQVGKAIKSLGLKDVNFKCMLHASRVTEALASSLEGIGTWFVHLGIESANQRTLDGIGKNLRISQVVNACRILKKHHIQIGGFFILYHVWEKDNRLCYETTADVENTFDFATHLLKTGLLDYISWAFLIPTPGSRAYETCRKFNLLKNEKSEEYSHDEISFSLPGISKSEMKIIKLRGMLLEGINAVKKRHINLRQLKYIIQKINRMLHYFVESVR
jgi:anaerobic magnesium-protoporphyrin IX monomethyl ester cyclase